WSRRAPSVRYRNGTRCSFRVLRRFHDELRLQENGRGALEMLAHQNAGLDRVAHQDCLHDCMVLGRNIALAPPDRHRQAAIAFRLSVERGANPLEPGAAASLDERRMERGMGSNPILVDPIRVVRVPFRYTRKLMAGTDDLA